MSEYVEDLPDPSLPDEPATAVKSEIAILKERAMKCKVIALDKMNKPVLANPSNFSKRDKQKCLKLMTDWFSKDDVVITTEFNDIILGDGFDEKAQYQHYSIDGDIEMPLPPPIKKEITNKQTLVKPDDWIDPYPSSDIDPASRSSYEIFSTNETHEADFIDGEFIKVTDEDGKFKEIKTQ